MNIAICIPLYERPNGVDYLPYVLSRLSLAVGSATVYTCGTLAAPQCFLNHNNLLSRHTVLKEDPGVNGSIVRLFDQAFEDGFDAAIYLADDCVPRPDFARISERMAIECQKQGHLAFGLWWPIDDRAQKYPELILERRGEVWPAKAFGVCRQQWAEGLGHIVRYASVTYDVALARFLSASKRHILVPLCPRVKDIGRIGRYATPEIWDRDFSWITSLAVDFTREYVVFQENEKHAN